MDELSASDVFKGDAPIERLTLELDNNFPVVNPLPSNTPAEIMYRAGQRSVIEFIKQLLE